NHRSGVPECTARGRLKPRSTVSTRSGRRGADEVVVDCLRSARREMKLRALVVEDDSAMRKLLARALPLTGLAEFEVTEAADGAEALARFNPARTDVIFVDWHMPHMTGI